MKHLLTIFFIATFFCASAQIKNTSAKAMTKQDSILLYNQMILAAADSIESKTSLKEFKDFLKKNVSFEMYTEGKLVTLLDAFMDNRLNQWIIKNKIVVPKN